MLGLDTGSASDSIALAQSGLIIASRQVRRPRRQGAALTVAANELLASVGQTPDKLAAIAVGVGPGAFTGLRVGMATAQGMASGLSLPTYGVCSLQAWAATMAGAALPVAVTLDARRSEVYTGLFGVDGAVSSLDAVSLRAPRAWFEALAARDEEAFHLVGDGARLYRALADEVLGGRARWSPWGDMAPSAGWIALEGARRLDAGDASVALRPVYLRDHDAAKPR